MAFKDLLITNVLFFTSALIGASIKGHTGIVILLLQNGANAFAANRRGHTALLRAAFAGHTPVISALLDHSMRVLDYTDEIGRSALILAMEGGNYGVIDQLLERLDNTEKRALIRRETFRSRSPLSHAAGAGRVESVQKLLPFATKLQIIRSQAKASTVRDTMHRVQIQHILFTAVIERCHWWILDGA